MANHTFDLALVKYYKEHLDEYATYMPFKISNTKDKPFYAKISIVDQGNLAWSFVDDSGNLVTEKTYTLNANSVLDLNEKLVALTTPTETQKDSISIRVEYFKDPDLTRKFGEDTITAPIHIFIQNSDYSWTSTQYENESDIVYDKWSFTDISLPIVSDNNLAKIDHYNWGNGSGRITLLANDPILEDHNSLFIKTWDDNRSHWYITDADGSVDVIQDKFLAMYLEVRRISGYFRLGFVSPKSLYDNYLEVGKFLSVSGTGSWKAVFYPIKQMAKDLFTKAAWGRDGHVYIILDGLYVFNKLP